MRTVSEIEDRLNALTFAGRSYSGPNRRGINAAYDAAVVTFEAFAASDIEYLIARVRGMQTAIIAAAAELREAASDIAASYAANDEETEEIRVIISDPVDKLVAIAQAESAKVEEADK